jgi:hypothetical protein
MHLGMPWPLVLAALGYMFAVAAIVVARTRAKVTEHRILALPMVRAEEARA